MHRVPERPELTFIGRHGVGLVPLQLLEDAVREQLHVATESREETEPLPEKAETAPLHAESKTYRTVTVRSTALLVFPPFHTLCTRVFGVRREGTLGPWPQELSAPTNHTRVGRTQTRHA